MATWMPEPSSVLAAIVRRRSRAVSVIALAGS